MKGSMAVAASAFMRRAPLRLTTVMVDAYGSRLSCGRLARRRKAVGRCALFAWDAASSRMLLNVVMQLNHTILEAFNGVQIQGHVTVTPRYQWNAIPNKHWGHTDDELIDRLLVKKGGDDLAAAHQPDVLARLLSKTAHEWTDGTVHELHAWRGVGWWRMTRE